MSDNESNVLYELSVELNQGNTVKIKVNQHSDPEELAFQFCKDNNCNFETLKNLKEKISNLLSKHEESSKKHITTTNNIITKNETSNIFKNNLIYNNNDKPLLTSKPKLFKPDKSPLLNSTKHPLKNNFLLLTPDHTYNSKDITTLNNKYSHSHISLTELAEKHKTNVTSKPHYQSKSISLKQNKIPNKITHRHYNNKYKQNKPSITTQSKSTNHHQTTYSSLTALSVYTNKILFGTSKDKSKLINNTYDIAFKPNQHVHSVCDGNSYNKAKSYRSNKLNISKQIVSQSYLKHYLSKSLLNVNDTNYLHEQTLTEYKQHLEKMKTVEERKGKMFCYLMNTFLNKSKGYVQYEKIPKDIEHIVKWLFPRNIKVYTNKEDKLLSYMRSKFEKLSFLDKRSLFNYYHNININ